MTRFLLASLALLACVCSLGDAFLGRKQTVSVRGRLVCGSDPSKAGRVRVKLVDEDFGPDPDDTMARGYTDESGNFQLTGSASEMGRIDPFLKIYHDCNDGAKPCQRKWKIEIPKSYINGDTFDTGVLNLDMKLPGEGRDCIH